MKPPSATRTKAMQYRAHWSDRLSWTHFSNGKRYFKWIIGAKSGAHDPKCKNDLRYGAVEYAFIVNSDDPLSCTFVKSVWLVFLLSLAACATSTIESRKRERSAVYAALPPDQRQLVDQ